MEENVYVGIARSRKSTISFFCVRRSRKLALQACYRYGCFVDDIMFSSFACVVPFRLTVYHHLVSKEKLVGEVYLIL